MNRSQNLQKLKSESFDICVIGAGASGTACALDAALRGFKVALIDRNDFASETSSHSTKLIHGGVRYLEQAFKNFDFGQLRQVKHGLEERHIVLKNAPHLAQPLPLITPVFSWIEGLYFTIGLKIYGWFAKNDSLPKSDWLSKKETFERMPTLSKRTHSAVLYYDGQLDDARYCLALAQSADEAGVAVANHVELLDFEKKKKLSGACVKDLISGEAFTIKAKLFINCTGPHADFVRLKANPKLNRRIRASKGVHLMLPPEVINSKTAMLIPKTKDGRVVFVIPFEGHTMVGTTDTEHENIDDEPILLENEVEFLLDTLAPYLAKKPNKNDIKAGFGGLRPLLAANQLDNTKKLVRDHEVEHDAKSGLLSLMGGKWTTYRLMAQDTVDEACEILKTPANCTTADQLLVGAEGYDFEHWQTLKTKYQLEEDTAQVLMKKYGSRAESVLKLTVDNLKLKEKLIDSQPYIKAQVVYAAREEMACKLRDVLARRMRLEITDWKDTLAVLPAVADLMQQELGWTDQQKQAEIVDYKLQIERYVTKAM